MLLNSYIFIFLFLPAFLILYFLLARFSETLSKILLIAGSVIFYGYASGKMLLFLLIDLAVNYLLIRIIGSAGKGKKGWLFVGITANILALFICKYLNFFRLTLDLPTLEILVPLGMSFFTFQQISYLVDTCHGKTKDHTVLEYAVYVLYFPKITMGPITKADHLVAQLRDPGNRRFQSGNFIAGIRRFTFGLAKKVLLAETFASMVSFIHYYQSAGMATSTEILLLTFGYTFEIYFDFSGYTDMAIGVSRMLNIKLAENFDSPYQALSIRDFWKRWHISLTRFLTEYLYIPLGGSRKGKLRTNLNVMIVFLVSGFWHGANWTYLLWGALHGGLQILDRTAERVEEKFPKPIRWLAAFLIGAVLFLLFQSDSIMDWLSALRTLFTSGDFTVHEAVFTAFELPEIKGLIDLVGWGIGSSTAALAAAKTASGVVMTVVFFLFSFILCLCVKNTGKREYRNTVPALIGSAVLLVFCITSLGSEAMFVYNNF